MLGADARRERELRILLVKNPAGANEVLRTLALEPGEHDLLGVLNDRIADGRDVSWIWDADFELLAGRVRRVTCCGHARGRAGAAPEVRGRRARAHPRAARPGPRRSRRGADRPGGAGESAAPPLYALPTYTAMLALRELLVTRGEAGATVHGALSERRCLRCQRTLRVCALYPDLMNIYADRGNLLVLERRCAWRGSASSCQRAAWASRLTAEATRPVLPRRRPGSRPAPVRGGSRCRLSATALHAAAARGAIVLGVCGGYQLLGDAYELGPARERRASACSTCARCASTVRA